MAGETSTEHPAAKRHSVGFCKVPHCAELMRVSVVSLLHCTFALLLETFQGL